MYNFKIKTSFLSPEMWKARLKKLVSFYLHFYIHRKLEYDAVLNFSVWLRTGSNPPDNNLFRMKTRNVIIK